MEDKAMRFILWIAFTGLYFLICKLMFAVMRFGSTGVFVAGWAIVVFAISAWIFTTVMLVKE